MSTILQGRPGDIMSEIPGGRCSGRTLDHDVAVFAQSRALHGEGGRGPSAGLRSEEEREHWETGEI